VERVLSVYWHLFPPTLILLGALAVLFVVRRGRDLMLRARAMAARERRLHRRADLEVAFPG